MGVLGSLMALGSLAHLTCFFPLLIKKILIFIKKKKEGEEGVREGKGNTYPYLGRKVGILIKGRGGDNVPFRTLK